MISKIFNEIAKPVDQDMKDHLICNKSYVC